MALDICNFIVSDLRLGLPADEDDVFEKLYEKEIISKKMLSILSDMKGFRNILMHKYGEIKDEIVFENLSNLSDFTDFVEEILRFLKRS